VLAHVVESTLFGFESYVCQLCVVVLLLIFNNMYEYGIGIVNLSCLECITNMTWLIGYALAW